MANNKSCSVAVLGLAGAGDLRSAASRRRSRPPRHRPRRRRPKQRSAWCCRRRSSARAPTAPTSPNRCAPRSPPISAGPATELIPTELAHPDPDRCRSAGSRLRIRALQLGRAEERGRFRQDASPPPRRSPAWPAAWAEWAAITAPMMAGQAVAQAATPARRAIRASRRPWKRWAAPRSRTSRRAIRSRSNTSS